MSTSEKTLRDEFAMAAIGSVSCGIIAEESHGTAPNSLSLAAYKIADAMLAARGPRDAEPGEHDAWALVEHNAHLSTLLSEAVALFEEFCEYTTLEGYREATEHARVFLAKVEGK